LRTIVSTAANTSFLGNGKLSIDSAELVGDRDQWRNRICDHINESADLSRRTAGVAVDSILDSAAFILKCFRSKNKVLICGNGGSAADAQHMAAEFVNRLSGNIERPALPAIALTTDTSILTSYANDMGYDGVFERQVRALGQSGDVLIGISTSGNSTSVVRAVAAANAEGVGTIGLLGEGGALTGLVDRAIVIPSRNTQHIQETLLIVEHAICAVVEEILFGQPPINS
jgi:D-sedoheptulose 7-phosphate isomerase